MIYLHFKNKNLNPQTLQTEGKNTRQIEGQTDRHKHMWSNFATEKKFYCHKCLQLIFNEGN